MPAISRSRLRGFPALGYALPWLYLLASAFCLFSSSPMTADDNQASERCIQCHSRTVTAAMARPELHWPFLARQCVICHLAESAAASGQGLEPQAGPERITGRIVTQEQLWRKRKVLTSAGIGVDHQMSISGLDIEAPYRFRIVLRDPAGLAGTNETATNWLGLMGAELPLSAGRKTARDVMELNAAEDKNIHDLELYRPGDSTLVISFHTPVPVYGEVQVEELGGLAATGQPGGQEPAAAPQAAAAGDHPRLRDPQAMGIDLCYSCHAKSSLGTSHPVGIYAGSLETHIPESLPTVSGGMLTCVTCHDPHGGNGKKLVREVIVTKLCVTCHTTFAGTSRSTIFK